MWPYVLVIVFLLSLSGCAKPKPLPEITVRATSSSELKSFLSDLAARFIPADLQLIDTALQELQLDAMNREIATVAAREQDMLAAINDKTVHELLLLGWTARRNRFLREIEVISDLQQKNLKTQQKTVATETPASVTTRLQNLQDILDRLHRNLTDTEQQLAELSMTIKVE